MPCHIIYKTLYTIIWDIYTSYITICFVFIKLHQPIPILLIYILEGVGDKQHPFLRSLAGVVGSDNCLPNFI